MASDAMYARMIMGAKVVVLDSATAIKPSPLDDDGIKTLQADCKRNLR